MMKRASVLTAACLVLMATGTAMSVPCEVDSHALHLYHFNFIIGNEGRNNNARTENREGWIDEVRLYNRALSDAEVAGLAGRTGPIHQGL